MLFRLLSWQRQLLRLIKYGGYAYTVITSFTSAGAVSVAFAHLRDGTGSLYAFLIAAKSPLIAAVTSVLTTWADRKSASFEKLASADIRLQPPWKSVYRDLDMDAQKSGCKVEEFDGMAGWTNPTLNRQLLLASGPHGKVVRYSCENPVWLDYKTQDAAQKSLKAKLRQYVIERAFERGRHVFNSRKVRLCADLEPDLSETVRLRETDYVSSMMTDGIAFERIFYKAEEHPISNGWSFFIEQRAGGKHLKSLLDSHSSNQLGASTFVFTSDGFLVLIDQTDRNQHSGGTLSPSGSGSFDWADVESDTSGNFLTVVKNAAAREFMEETGLDRDTSFSRLTFARDNMVIIGFTRIIHRAGKPEFFCLARIDRTITEIEALKTKRKESTYTQKSLAHDASALNPRAPFKEEITRICRHYFDPSSTPSDVEVTHRHRLSYQVMHGLALLEACLTDPQSVDVLKNVLQWPT
jgi:8-oxo-dGTP pyrophosphatase MutT (NUDIX family)